MILKVVADARHLREKARADYLDAERVRLVEPQAARDSGGKSCDGLLRSTASACPGTGHTPGS